MAPASSTARRMGAPCSIRRYSILRTVGHDGRDDRQLTYGDQSFVEPDVHQSGCLLASRIRSQSDIWKFAVGGTPSENTRGRTRVTRQTGQAQTPSVSPNGAEIAYLSDNGGHGNLWIATMDGSSVRQITFERDPAVSVGVPMWSPAGDWIAFVVAHESRSGAVVDPARRQRVARAGSHRMGPVLGARRPTLDLHDRPGRPRASGTNCRRRRSAGRRADRCLDACSRT